MRVLLACAVVGGCHAATIIPAAKPAPDEPAPVSTLSFLERTSPPGELLDVPHAEVVVTRREGPDAIDGQLSDISEHMQDCYMAALEYSTLFKHGASTRDRLTVSIETHPSGVSDVDVEPAYTPEGLAACLVQALIRGHFDAGRKPTRVVLAVDASTWFTAR